MLEQNSLMTRLIVGKGIGFLIGLMAFVFLPYYFNNNDVVTQWGFLVWYTLFGAVIGVFGIYAKLPVLNISFPWWVRGAYLGAILNLSISLIAYDALAQMMLEGFGENGFFLSPFWFVLEGMIVGLIIDFLATKLGGEGIGIVSNNN